MTENPQNSSISRMRRGILEMATAAQEGHVPSALSILEIVWTIYEVRLPERQSAGYERDRFVLSKGHGALALYQVLSQRGVLDPSHLHTFCSFNSILGGHPDRTQVPGVEASTGSLGHGLPIGLGMALGEKISGNNGHIYVLVGDGEINEGTTWESALLAYHHRLDNITCIVDYNHSTDRALGVDPISQKFAAFGWGTLEVDGHDVTAISSALRVEGDGPMAIIANTVKGNGVHQMENAPAWHHGAPTVEQLREMLRTVL